MIRTFAFLILYLLTLGALSIRISFSDGLNIRLIGWVEWLQSGKS